MVSILLVENTYHIVYAHSTLINTIFRNGGFTFQIALYNIFAIHDLECVYAYRFVGKRMNHNAIHPCNLI